MALLKKNEDLITVCGGEHCGALFGTIVSGAAVAEMSAKEYYSKLIHMVDNNEVPEGFEEYSDVVYKISEVMVKHYDSYINTIWEKEQKKINEYIPEVLDIFEKTNFTEQAEKIVGSKLTCDFFTATLVSSVENGAEAIDISDEQDVFGIERTPQDEFHFIGHEFIIYLLFDVLKEEKDFRTLRTWNITEGLAEFYLKQITGELRFHYHQKYVEFYEKAYGAEQLTAVELYRKGLKNI